MLIKIVELIGKFCSTRKSTSTQKGGEEIRNLINENWDKEELIEISFAGVETATPSFIDESIAKLLETHSLDNMKSKLIFSDVTDDKKLIINQRIRTRIKMGTGNTP